MRGTVDTVGCMGGVKVVLVGGPLDGRRTMVGTAWWGFPPARIAVVESEVEYVLDVDEDLREPFRYRSVPVIVRPELDDDRVEAVRGVLGESGFGPYADDLLPGATVEVLHTCLLEMVDAHGACRGCRLCWEVRRALTLVAAMDVVAGPDSWPDPAFLIP